MFFKKFIIICIVLFCLLIIFLIMHNPKKYYGMVINILLEEKEVINTERINNYIEELNSFLNQYEVSVLYYNMNNAYTYKYRENVIYYGASLIKVVDALYVYENMELTNELKTLVSLAIMKSDNLAHQKLVEKIGFTNLKSYGEQLGAQNILTNGRNDIYGLATIDDELIYLKHLYNFLFNDVNNEKEKLKSYFINNYFNYLDFSNAPLILHKYGYYGTYYHDMGIFLDKNPYIVVILTKESPNFSLVTEISQKIFELHKLIYKKNYSIS